MFILPTRVLRIIIVWKSLVWRVAFLDFRANFCCALLICGTRSHLCTKRPNRRHLSVRDMERILGMLQAGATQSVWRHAIHCSENMAAFSWHRECWRTTKRWSSKKDVSGGWLVYCHHVSTSEVWHGKNSKPAIPSCSWYHYLWTDNQKSSSWQRHSCLETSRMTPIDTWSQNRKASICSTVWRRAIG